MTVKTRPTNTRAERRRQLAAARKSGAEPGAGSSWLASSSNRNLLICLLLATATFALYIPAIGHPFIFNYDDDTYVINNSHVQAGLAWQTVTWALTSTDYSNWHPLTWLSHALDCEVWGMDPSGHHFTSVLFHVLNVVLLFLLLVRVTRAAGRSLLVAALFAVHPLNVQSVAWVAERKSVLSTFFFLLTLAAYGWYALKPSVKRYLAVAALFVFALASKPMVITLPCVLLLLDFWPLRRIQAWGHFSPQDLHDQPAPAKTAIPTTAFPVPPSPFWRLVLEKLPLLALSAASAAITVIASRSYGSMRLALPLGLRIENAVYSYAMYVWKAFWPVRLAVFYPHPGATLTAWQVGWAALFVVSVSAMVWRKRFARPYLVTGWLWFLGTLVPAIGLIQVGEQRMADRYAYIPLIGIFVMVAWGAAEFADRTQFSFASRASTAVIVLAILSLVTWRQIGYWQSAYDLWSQAVQVTKNNFMAEENLSAALLALGRADEAVPHLQNAIRIKPEDPAVHLNLAGALAMSNRNRDAIQEYEFVIPRLSNPNMQLSAYETLGRLYAAIGNYAKARASYQEALRINPQGSSARDGLAQVDFSDALRNAAESPSGANYLRVGQLLQQQGRTEEARAAYEQALKLAPKLSDARRALDALKDSN